MNYTLINFNPSLAHIRFSGKLNNNNVIWDAQIHTLKSIVQTNNKIGIKQFIEIEINDTELKPIKIGLNVTTITKPVLLKTVIMITNYKKLKQGRHEYGEVYYFNN